LRVRLADAVNALRKQTRFGLVFEGHHPEVSRLPDVPIRKGGLVARRSEKGNVLYRVSSITATKAVCLPEELPKDAGDDLFAHMLTIPVADLVAARRFGDAIYPSLKLVDAVEHGGDKPWHVLIQADNYHALQALGYTHSGKVDVIYIDPPYNTGARDWRYNNDYVDLNDPWRHSKWLSFMEKRLLLAERLLKPDGVLVVTIDEHEVHHLGCLLAQIFPKDYRQMVTIVINEKGVAQGRFSRAEEYAVFVFRGASGVAPQADDLLSPDRSNSKRFKTPRWEWLLRGGTNSRREDRKTLFFPVYVDPEVPRIVEIGEPVPWPTDPPASERGTEKVAWPIRRDGSFGNWRVSPPTLRGLLAKGYVKLGGFDKKRGTWTILYLGKKAQTEIAREIITITGRDSRTGSVEVDYAETQQRQIKTVWHRRLHDAGNYGSHLLRAILGEGSSFPFPKSLYAVRDTLVALLRSKRDSVVLDFFAGSGTTFHAVSLMNSVDGGSRQCILVTNNEVSEDDRKKLLRAAKVEGHPDWDSRGICRAVTWPRCKNVVAGRREDDRAIPGEYLTGKLEDQEAARAVIQLGFVDGATLDLAGRKDVARLVEGISVGAVSASDPWHLDEEGKASILWDASKSEGWLEALTEALHVERLYIATRQKTTFKRVAAEITEGISPMIIEREITRPMAAGLKENIAYFELGFLDPGDVARGKQFASILPLLWMLTGAKAECPKAGRIDKWLITQECGFAVLHNEELFLEFRAELKGMKGIRHIFLVTDSEDTFKEMRAGLRRGTRTHMLYSSYLRNFGINVRSAP
jgi:adenine-specific DNA-methyltransferase